MSGGRHSASIVEWQVITKEVMAQVRDTLTMRRIYGLPTDRVGAPQRDTSEQRARRLGHTLGRWEHDIVLGRFEMIWCNCGAYILRDPMTGATRGPAMSVPHLWYLWSHAARRASLPPACNDD